MNLELNKLRIDHPRETYGRGASRVWMVLFFVLLLISAAAVGYLLKFPPTGGIVEVQVERVRAATPGKDPGTGFSAAGWVKLPRYHPVYVTPLTEGRVEEVLVIEGDRVKKDQVLARLYKEDYRAASEAAAAMLKAAEANHEKLKAGYRKQEVSEARAEVKRLEAEWKVAGTVLEHSRKLHPSGAISLEELQRDETRSQTAEAALTKARERMALLEEGFRREDIALAAAEVEKARADLTLARQKLGYTDILSPMDGKVLERLVSCGHWLTPGRGIIVSLFDPADLEARIDVNQDDIARVFQGQGVDITTRAEAGVTHRGKVVLIEPMADLVKNTVPVRVKIEKPETGLIHPDMVVKARFRARKAGKTGGKEKKSPGITVAADAVLTEGGDHYLFILHKGKARRVKVVPGRLENGRYEILDGLHGGEQVITSGLDGLAEGMAVRTASSPTN